MGLDYGCYVKSANGNMIHVASGFYSTYFGMYKGELYNRGNFTDVIKTLIKTYKQYPNETVYYGHDHQSESEYVPVTFELIYELTKLWVECLKIND